MPIIKAIVSTKLKKAPIDSTDLHPFEINLINQNHELAVYTLEPSTNGHSKVTLDLNTMSISFIVSDPWYEFDALNWTYSPWSASGDKVRYSARLMYASGVAGQSFDDARALYNQKTLVMNQPGMWLHLIKN